MRWNCLSKFQLCNSNGYTSSHNSLLELIPRWTTLRVTPFVEWDVKIPVIQLQRFRVMFMGITSPNISLSEFNSDMNYPQGYLFCWSGEYQYSHRSIGASFTVSLARSLASWKNHHHIWGLLAISGPAVVQLNLGFWWHMMHLYSYTGTFYPSKECSRASNLTWRLIWTIWKPQGFIRTSFRYELHSGT